MQSIDSFCLGRFKMHVQVLVILLFFLGGTPALKIGIAEDRNINAELKTCLATVVEKVCPYCVTGHLVVPTKPSWEADALASHFWESTLTYALTIYTMDRPGYEDPSVDQVGLYPVNTEAELTRALKHLRETNSKRNCVIWVNFYFGRSLSNYLKSTTPATWNRGRGWSVVFVGLNKGDVQVFGTPIQRPGSSEVQSFRNLSFCDTKALIEVSQPFSKVVESNKKIITVAVSPRLLPYIRRHTNNPGGYIGRLMNTLKNSLNFTPKYIWSVDLDDFDDFAKEDGPRIAFDLNASPKKIALLSSTFLRSEGVWMIATPDTDDRQNFLVRPLRNNIFLHIALLAMYTSVMMCLSRELDKTRIMLRLFGMFFGIGVGWLPTKGLYRFLVVLWCFTSYIFLQTYLAALTSQLSIPMINEPIRDTDDLMNSGIKMFCMRKIQQFYCRSPETAHIYICKECRNLNLETWQLLVSNKSGLNKTERPFAATLGLKTVEAYFSGKSTTIMQQRIGTWPAMIYTNMDTKFLTKVYNFSERLGEAGILYYWLTRYELKNTDNNELGNEMLNMSLVNDVFIVLYVGWSCGILIFFIELLAKRYYSE